MTRRRFDLTLPVPLAERLEAEFREEDLRDVENFLPRRPRTQILESIVAAGLELRAARRKLQESKTYPSQVVTASDTPQKQPARTNNR